MAQLPSETLTKLTELLATDVDTYNDVIQHIQRDNEEIRNLEASKAETENKLTETAMRADNYVNQISNLLSRIPVGESKAQQSLEQTIEEIKNREW